MSIYTCEICDQQKDCDNDGCYDYGEGLICEDCASPEYFRGVISHLQAENEKLREKYSELIMAVATKYPNESRHETALKYIERAETTEDETAKQALDK